MRRVRVPGSRWLPAFFWLFFIGPVVAQKPGPRRERLDAAAPIARGGATGRSTCRRASRSSSSPPSRTSTSRSTSPSTTGAGSGSPTRSSTPSRPPEGDAGRDTREDPRRLRPRRPGRQDHDLRRRPEHPDRRPAAARRAREALVHSIPNIYRLRDTDGDGKADRREVLYGTFGFTRHPRHDQRLHLGLRRLDLRLPRLLQHLDGQGRGRASRSRCSRATPTACRPDGSHVE